MNRLAPICINAFLFVVLMFASDSSFAGSLGGPTCVLENGDITVNFGNTKPPTYAVLISPNDKVFYLRYPPESYDVLGKGYLRGKFKIALSSATGYVGDGSDCQRALIFTTPGTYSFRFRDANTAMGMDIHSLECSVTVSEQALQKYRPKSAAAECRSLGLVASTDAVYQGNAQDFPVGCNYVGSCAGKPCCSKASVQSPCYCSLCVSFPGRQTSHN